MKKITVRDLKKAQAYANRICDARQEVIDAAIAFVAGDYIGKDFLALVKAVKRLNRIKQ